MTLGRWLNNGSEIRAVDLSGDGIPDLVSADGESQGISVWQGKGNGTFRARRTYRTAAEVFDVDVSDINGDAKPDLIAAGAAQNGPITILAKPAGQHADLRDSLHARSSVPGGEARVPLSPGTALRLAAERVLLARAASDGGI